MPILSFQDAYLARFCTEEREARAFDDVDAMGAFSAFWRNQLAVVRCYILACLENQADAEDLFSAKLKNYRTEFNTLLAQARAATEDGDGNPLSVFSIPLERG